MRTSAETSSLADRLRDVMVSLRGELAISRHVFRAGPSYVVRDPVTFQTHRFDPEDYRVLTALHRQRTLGQTFEDLVDDETLSRDDEEAFYAYVVDLHQRNLLSLPIGDGDALFKRFEKRRQAERLSRVLGVFFMRIPVINPDRLVASTIPMVRWLFMLPGLIAWIVLAGAAGAIAWTRWDDLTATAGTAFDGNGLVTMWFTLIVLKVIHEFGHAYACKAFGGHVPEMGIYLVLFTPLAYVDASDSWSFPKTHRRAIVTLAGVYVESMTGAIAMIVWAMTDPSALHSIAYQIVLLATVTTALFNLNPLLRYDAYYLVSDLSGVPNLRARCQHALSAVFKRIFYGVRRTAVDDRPTASIGLVLFGAAQLAYRVLILVTLTSVIVMKFGVTGLGLAGLFVGMTIGRAVLSLVRYLISADELTAKRGRAIAVTAVLVVGAIAGTMLIPVARPIHARGIVTLEHVRMIHAPRDGTLTRRLPHAGEMIPAGETIVQLMNTTLDSSRNALLAQYAHDRTVGIRAGLDSVREAIEQRETIRVTRATLEQKEQDVEALTIDVTRDVQVVGSTTMRSGQFVRSGDPLLRIGHGATHAIVLLGASEHDALRLNAGDVVTCRSPVAAERDVRATVLRIAEQGSRTLSETEVEFSRTLGLHVDPATGEATEPYFRVRLALDASDLPPGGSLRIVLPAEKRTLGRILERSLARFMNRMKQGLSR